MIIIFKPLHYIKESENFKFNMIQSARTSRYQVLRALKKEYHTLHLTQVRKTDMLEFGVD